LPAMRMKEHYLVTMMIDSVYATWFQESTVAVAFFWRSCYGHGRVKCKKVDSRSFENRRFHVIRLLRHAHLREPVHCETESSSGSAFIARGFFSCG
jgi:hypothetical protein